MSLKKSLTVVFLFGGLIIIAGCSSEVATEQEDDKGPLVEETNENNMEADLHITNTLPTEGMEDGYFSKSYPNGVLQVEGIVVNGKRSGLWKSYHPAGNIQSENNYMNGSLDGKTVVYYPSGQIMYIGYYANGKSDGQWLYFDQEGTLTKEVIYKNGEIVSQVEKNEKPTE